MPNHIGGNLNFGQLSFLILSSRAFVFLEALDSHQEHEIGNKQTYSTLLLKVNYFPQ